VLNFKSNAAGYNQLYLALCNEFLETLNLRIFRATVLVKSICIARNITFFRIDHTAVSKGRSNILFRQFKRHFQHFRAVILVSISVWAGMPDFNVLG